MQASHPEADRIYISEGFLHFSWPFSFFYLSVGVVMCSAAVQCVQLAALQ